MKASTSFSIRISKMRQKIKIITMPMMLRLLPLVVVMVQSRK